MFRLTWVFLIRDARNTSPFVFFGGLAEAIFSVVFWFFVIRFFRQGTPVGEGVLPTDYFTFGLVGLALSQYVWRGFASFSNRLKSLQISGALETLWLAPHPFLRLVVLFGAWDLVCACVYAAAILGVGTIGFGANLTFSQGAQIVGIGMTVAVSAGCYALLIASCHLVWGYAESVRNLLSKGVLLLSGAFFPVNLLPLFVRSLALLLPLTHALFLARRTVGLSQPVGWGAWAMLVALTGALLLLTSVVWRGAVRMARVTGRMTAP